MTSQDRAQFFTVNIQDGPRKEKFAVSKISVYVWKHKRGESFRSSPFQCTLAVFVRSKTPTDLCNMQRCAVTVVQPNAIKQSENRYSILDDKLEA